MVEGCTRVVKLCQSKVVALGLGAQDEKILRIDELLGYWGAVEHQNHRERMSFAVGSFGMERRTAAAIFCGSPNSDHSGREQAGH